MLVSRSVHPSTSINCVPLDFINFFHWANGLSRISGAELPKAINVKFATSYYPNVGKKASDDGKKITLSKTEDTWSESSMTQSTILAPYPGVQWLSCRKSEGVFFWDSGLWHSTLWPAPRVTLELTWNNSGLDIFIYQWHTEQCPQISATYGSKLISVLKEVAGKCWNPWARLVLSVFSGPGSVKLNDLSRFQIELPFIHRKTQGPSLDAVGNDWLSRMKTLSENHGKPPFINPTLCCPGEFTTRWVHFLHCLRLAFGVC